MFRALGNLPTFWLPYVFTSIDDAADFLGNSLQFASRDF